MMRPDPAWSGRDQASSSTCRRDEAGEQERLRVGVLKLKSGRATKLRDIFRTHGIDAGNRRVIRAGPLRGRELDRHSFRIRPLRIETDQGLQPVAGAFRQRAGKQRRSAALCCRHGQGGKFLL